MTRAASPTETDSSDAEMTEFERAAASSGFTRIAGIDEAGRGPLAGPIVAGAVVLHETVHGLNDSKLLSPRRREALYQILQDGPHQIGVHIIDAATIDAQGIQAANYAAMLNAAGELDPPPDFLLVDGFEIPGSATPLQRIIKGDRRSVSIAAASIIAKVTRDHIMLELDAVYPQYGFAQHKGYGTKAHIQALRDHGPCPEHRKSFAPLANHNRTPSLFKQEDMHA